MKNCSSLGCNGYFLKINFLKIQFSFVIDKKNIIHSLGLYLRGNVKYY